MEFQEIKLKQSFVPEVSTQEGLTKLATQVSEPEEIHSIFRESIKIKLLLG